MEGGRGTPGKYNTTMCNIEYTRCAAHLAVEVVLDDRRLAWEGNDRVRSYHLAIRRESNGHPPGEFGINHGLQRIISDQKQGACMYEVFEEPSENDVKGVPAARYAFI